MMASYESNEDSLIIFLSGFNQVFLSCLLLNILISTSLGGQSNAARETVSGDYDFEVKTALDRGGKHSTVVAGLIAITVAAVVFVSVSKAVHNYRRLNISVLDIYLFNRQ